MKQEHTRREFGRSALALGLTGSGIATAATFEAAAAPNYYVAPNGDDSNPGTKDQPFATLPRAFDEDLGPGDVVNLEQGTYFKGDDVIRIEDVSGDPNNPIIVNGNNATLQFDADGLVYSGVKILNCENIELRNIRVTGSGKMGIEARYGKGLTFRNIESDNNFLDGLYLNNCGGCLVERCELHHNQDLTQDGEDADGLLLLGSKERNVMRRVSMHHNSDDGVDCYTAENQLFDRCISYANGAGDAGDGNGFKLGIAAGPSGGHLVHNCVAYDNRSEGFVWNLASIPIEVYNCTAYNNDSDGFVFSEGEHYLKNNIAFGNDDRAKRLNSQVVHENNTWNLGIADPGFMSTDPSSGDFLRLTADSPCIDAGTDVGLDYQGSAPDLGAYGYSGGDDDGTALPHRIIFTADAETNYRFAVSGDLDPLSTVDPHDDVDTDADTVRGFVGDGYTDEYDFSGGITEFGHEQTDGSLSAEIDGRSVPLDQVATPRLLVVNGENVSSQVSFRLATSGRVQRSMEGGASINGNDSISREGETWTVDAQVNGGTDAYRFVGAVADFEVTDGDASELLLTLDGQERDPGSFGGPSENTITFDGRDGRGSYELTVSGDIAKSTDNGASIDPNDTIEGSTAAGQVNGGRDSYVFDGEIESISADPAITVLLNGSEYELGKRVEVSRAPESSGEVDYIIESSGTLNELEGINSEDAASGSKARGTVLGGTDTYRLLGGEIQDVSTFGGDVTVTVN